MKLLLVLGVFVVGASGSCRNRCGEDSDYTCSCAARCSWFFQSTGCCDDYFAYCGVSYPIPSPDPTYFPTYHPPETPEHPTYYPPATEAPTYYPPQRCNNPGPIENGYISSDQHFFNIGDTVNYACKTGYQLKPAESRQRVCTSSYFISFLQTPYWTPEKPICEKTCPAPSFPTHGSYSPSGQTRFLAGKRITYTCSFGYKLEGSKVRKCLLSGRFSGFTSCKKILPCEKNPCDTNADCTNIGTDHFNCDCKDGYTGDGKTCSQIFPCDSMPCDPNANCTDIGTTHFQCDCLPGYTGTGKECTITCPAPKLPEHGSYSPAEQSRYNLGSNITYTCDIGYKLVGDKIRHCMRSGEFSGFARCREINPCRDYNPCDPNAVCTNIDNLRYTCDCKDDYVGDGKKCRKLRPCEYKPCHDNATCKDVNDALYTCDCIPGYKGNGLECIRIFPCETNPCHSMADCIDVSYTKYTCNCVQGYRGNGKFCEKIDPCKNHQCSLCSTCIPNADGLGHTCVCNSGYFGDGKSCKKPCDEHSCHHLATCYPHECGNPSCECNVGYEGSGTFCRPIDPCRLVKCTDHSTCKVIRDAPECICDSGYRPLPGGECQRDCPVPEFPANGQYGPIQRTYPVGSKITYTCADGYRVVGFETRECLGSLRFSGFAICEPIPTTLPPTPPPPSCKGKCGAYSFGSACACDPACINYGNCCHDYAQYCSAYVGR